MLRAVSFVFLLLISSIYAEECVAPKLFNSNTYTEYYNNGNLFGNSTDLGAVEDFECNSKYITDSCCSSAYTIDVTNKADPISAIFEKKIRRWAYKTCATAVQGLACIFCHPSQEEWIETSAGVPVIELCSDYCERLFDSCDEGIWRDSCNEQGEECVSVKIFFTEDGSVNKTTAAAHFCFHLFHDNSEDSEVFVSLDSRDKSLQYCFDDLDECTESDYVPIYSECDSQNTRSSSYQLKPTAKCAGGFKKPEGKDAIPCEISCEEGFYLDISSELCMPCEPGHYSLGGGFRISNWEDAEVSENAAISTQTWKVGRNAVFRTYCERVTWEKNILPYRGGVCGWIRQYSTVISGNNTINDDSMNSVLETEVLITANAGKVKFSYMVEGERNYDGLKFYIDDVVAMDLVSDVSELEIKEYNLPSGYHTLKWKYEKDSFASTGDDMATLGFVEIVGIGSADLSCTPCPPGYFQHTMGASQCFSCPANFYQPAAGQASCLECDRDHFAYSGATACEERPLCTLDDYGHRYKQCHDGQRIKEYYPIDVPQFCNSRPFKGGVSPPEDELVDCAQCEPGQRKKSSGCVACEDGRYSTESDVLECTKCTAGKEAIQTYTKTVWEEPLDTAHWNTNCTDDCGSTGWRMVETYADSGIGHGSDVQSTLTLSLNILEPATVHFEFEVTCQSSRCVLMFSFNGQETSSLYPRTGKNWGFGTSYGRTTLHEELTLPLEKSAGTSYPFPLVLTWIFTKYDPTEDYPNDRVKLFNVSVKGADIGGATSCDPCKPGEFNGHDEGFCQPAEIGHYVPDTGSTRQLVCEGNTFADKEGMSACKPCGNGVEVSSPVKSGCNSTCQFTPQSQDFSDPAALIRYDVESLRSDTQMYGPIIETLPGNRKHLYYLNVCSKRHTVYGCLDINHNPIQGYACQITTGDFGVSLGSEMGYEEKTGDQLLNGFFLVYKYGEPCPPVSPGGPPVERLTRIDMICDPDGYAGPKPYYDDGIVEKDSCVYEFKWRTPAACPLCNSLFWRYNLSECVGGYQYKQYRWIEPKSCVGGKSLPKDVEISCFTDAHLVTCKNGEYVNADNFKCTPASRGAFAIQHGEDLNYWPESWLEYYDSALVTDGWKYSLDTRGLKPASYNTSFASFMWNFTQPGTIEVEYKVYADNDDDSSGLGFFINDKEVAAKIHDTQFEWARSTLNVTTPGIKIFKLSFEGASEPSATSALVGATVRYIRVRGTNYVPLTEELCPAGYTSESRSGSSSCKLCNGETYSPMGGSCKNCWSADEKKEDYVSFEMGPTECVKKDGQCTVENGDLYMTYSECSRGQRRKLWHILEPAECIYTESSVPDNEVESCSAAPCRPGYFRSGDKCTRCETGYYYDTQQAKCLKVEAGSKAVPVLGLYFESSPEPAFPSNYGMSTSCTGSCGVMGWVSAGKRIVSGNHRNFEADSFVTLNITLIDDGSVTFFYKVVTDSVLNGLRFYVDGSARDIPYNAIAVLSNQLKNGWIEATEPLIAGTHILRWNYHQDAGSSGHAEMKEILIKGASNGGAVAVEKCPAGTYSSNTGAFSCAPCRPGETSSEGSTACNPCGENQISENPASPVCHPCGSLTNANPSHTMCDNHGCRFQNPTNNRTYDFTGLSYLNGQKIPLSLSKKSMILNVCERKGSPLCVKSDANDRPTPIVTNVCLIDKNDEGRDFGRIMGVTFASKKLRKRDEETDVVTVTYSYGGTEGCEQTILELICQVNATNTLPIQSKDISVKNPCEFKLQLNTRYACPLCIEEFDYYETTTECVKGKKIVQKSRVSNCNGPETLSSTELDCQYEYKFPLAAVIVGVIIFFILLLVVVLVVVRNRKIEQQYSLLLNNTEKTYELSNIESQTPTKGSEELEMKEAKQSA